MIDVDISNIWGQIALPDLLAMEKEVADAHTALLEGEEYQEWRKLPVRESTREMNRILLAAHKIRGDSEICVVVGTGGSVLGAQAAIALLQGPNRNLNRGKNEPQLLFVGSSLSTRAHFELNRLLQDKDFSIIVISKSGTTTEPAIAFRSLRWMLERKYGTDEANKRIYAVTDPCRGALHQMAQEEGWEAFHIPAGIGGRFSVLTAVGLLPMAVAGIDILAVMNGAADAREGYAEGSFENPVWRYAAVRNLLYRSGKAVELLVGFEPSFPYFGSWWQQLFGESEGKGGKGLFPAFAQFPADLHSLGQLLQEGERNVFETMVRFAPPETEVVIGGDWKNLDNLNYLEGKSLSFVEEQAYHGTVAAHVDGGVPVIAVDCGELSDRKLGELFYFFQMCCGISGYILGVDPFSQPGVEIYKRNMFTLLGKPGYDL